MKHRVLENGPFNPIACASASAHRDLSIRIDRELRILFFASAAALLSAACGGVTSTASGETGGTGGVGGGGGGGGTSTGGTSSSGGTGGSDGGATSSGGTLGTGGTGGASGGAGGVLSRVPKNHRAVATPCDSVRPSNPPAFPADAGIVGECRLDADCTSGVNGRCTPGRGFAQCTYDTCFSDADCAKGTVPGPLSGPAVCGCETGFSDNNTCLDPGGCLVDADCKGGFCSPTLGDCGNYGGVTGYYCHTPSDECVDDADCGGGYCAYSQVAGHWACSSSQCAG